MAAEDKNMDDTLKLAASAQIDSDMTALLTSTDASIPAAMRGLIGKREGNWEIVSVTSGVQRRFEPSAHIPDPQKRCEWNMGMVCDKNVDPPAVLKVRHGYYARVLGNALSCERWLREQGYHWAFAGSPNAVWIGERCTGRMILQYGNWHQCNFCEYATED